MADSSFNNRLGDKRRTGGGGTVYSSFSTVQLPNVKRANKMGAKIGWLIADWIGIPLSLLGIVINMDNVKSTVIALLAMIYLMLRIYFYFVQKQQAVREKEIDLWFREQDKQDRINKNKKS
jgi:hypothetical protein